MSDTWFHAIAAIMSTFSGILIPLLLYKFKQAGDERERQHQENKLALEDRTTSINTAVNRIENHLISRIADIGRRLDEHIDWHIGKGRD